MQILHRFAGMIQRYSEELSDPDRYRPDHCPQCAAQHPLRAHGFYMRTLVDLAFDGMIRVRRYLCCCCKRTVSLLPEFALPYLRFGIGVIALFLVTRLLLGLTLKAAAAAARVAAMPYQRGQFWVRRFRRQAENLSAALAALIAPPAARDFTSKALQRKPPTAERAVVWAPGSALSIIVCVAKEICTRTPCKILPILVIGITVGGRC